MYRRFCTFLRAPTKWWQLPRALFQPSPIHYLVHLERLDHLQVAAFRYVRAIDDFEATVRYKDHELRLWMGWEGDLVLMSSEQVPQELFDEMCTHLHAYKRASIVRVNEYKKMYARPAKATWYEK